MNVNINPLEKASLNQQNINSLASPSKTQNNSIEYLYLSALKAFLLRASKDNLLLDEKFITPQELSDVNSLNVKIFLDAIRSEQVNLYSKNLLEMFLYPISKDVKIVPRYLGDFIDPVYKEENTDDLFGNIKSSKECLITFRKFVVAVEKEYFPETGVSTEISYDEFKSMILSSPKDEVNNRYKVLAYFFANVLEYLLIAPLNREKRNKLKQLIRFVNSRPQKKRKV